MSTKTKAGTKKTSPTKEKALTVKNLENASKATNRVTKYLYTPNMTLQEKKEFRRKARATERSFNKGLRALGKSKESGADKKLKDLQKEQATFHAQTYTKA